MHGAVTAAFESAAWKFYQLDRVLEQKKWGISAWLSRLNYWGLIRKGLPEQLSALTRNEFGYSDGSGDFPELDLALVAAFYNTIIAACIEAAAPLMIA